MGSLSDYKCPICNYEYHGSGGPDHGMRCEIINTFNCLDCNETSDLYVDYPESRKIQTLMPRTFWMKVFGMKPKIKCSFETEKRPEVIPSCSYCKSTHVVQWDKRCPKCYSEMIAGFAITMWD